ncbi:MAG TPA: pitrilysin family protein [Bryobacteraceae bacterium]|nr:pitrilysin family protein [Bryobacteraceae bacterium]
MKFCWTFFLMATTLFAGPAIAQPGKSPLITLRLVFRTGAAVDPQGKEGLASLTAAMVAEGGTRRMTYQQIIDALFPMATNIEWQVDKEMTTFGAETHLDNLEKFYAIFREMLIEPGWRDEDLRRLKDEAVNFLQNSLRSANDEELGKEVLYQEIYKDHPYGHHNMGRVAAIRSLTLDDLKQFYRANYTQSNLTVAIAGNYPTSFPARMQKDFAKLPKGKASAARLPAPKPLQGRRLTMVQKETRSVAISMGFPIEVIRGHADYVPLLVAQSYLGQHRTSGVRLFDRMREIRGLNYGDYAYIEYFPRGMFQFEPDPNLARRQQIFQLWIRPVVPENAHFTLRLAMFELERLYRDGLNEEQFEKTRNFLSKYVNLLTKTKRAELGYAIDSQFYGIPDYNSYLKSALARTTREAVNAAIRKHLSPENITIVLVGQDCAKLRDAIVSQAASPISYNSPKPDDILEEDKMVEKLPLRIKAENIRIIKVETIFE